jgi:hypothetical protein
MTPYEEAKHLIKAFLCITSDFETAKKCALFMANDNFDRKIDWDEEADYWENTKSEIEAMANPLINTEARADRFNEDL